MKGKETHHRPGASAPSDAELDYLLSGGGLDGQTSERIRARVVQQAQRVEVPARPRLRFLGWGSALVAAGAAAVALLVPWGESQKPALRAKGPATLGPSLEVECLRGEVTACPRGSTIAFSVRGAPNGAFVTAYAEPAGGGERVWYLDNELTTSSNLPDAALGFAVKGARIGSEHVVGEYRGRILLTTRPITRDEAKTLTAGEGIEASASFDLTVTP